MSSKNTCSALGSRPASVTVAPPPLEIVRQNGFYDEMAVVLGLSWSGAFFGAVCSGAFCALMGGNLCRSSQSIFVGALGLIDLEQEAGAAHVRKTKRKETRAMKITDQ